MGVSDALTLEQRMRSQFEHLIFEHKMEILLDQGLYRHLRFKGESLTYWFELVTWPGFLAINGDLVSGFTFTRIPDMFAFFDSGGRLPLDGGLDPLYINPQYWEEKITCPYTNVRNYGEYDAEAGEAPWEWEPSFLLSCHAIRWGVAKYREAKGG